jgi:hypothetical protein
MVSQTEAQGQVLLAVATGCRGMGGRVGLKRDSKDCREPETETSLIFLDLVLPHPNQKIERVSNPTLPMVTLHQRQQRGLRIS